MDWGEEYQCCEMRGNMKRGSIWVSVCHVCAMQLDIIHWGYKYQVAKSLVSNYALQNIQGRYSLTYSFSLLIKLNSIQQGTVKA